MNLASVLFSFNGRINRKTFWLKGLLPLWGAAVAYILLAYMLEDLFTSAPRSLIVTIPGIVFHYTRFAILAKRFHDLGMSGWWGALAIIPVVGTVIVIIIGCVRGNQGPNKYDPNFSPLKETESQW